MPRTVIQPWGVALHLAMDLEAWRRLARRFDLDPEPAAVGKTHLVLAEGEGHRPQIVVWLMPQPGNPAGAVATAAHEAVHIAAMVLDHVGTELHGESETLAYLTEWLMLWMMRHIPADH